MQPPNQANAGRNGHLRQDLCDACPRRRRTAYAFDFNQIGTHPHRGLAGFGVGQAQLLRRTRIDLPTLTLSFWMTVLTAVVMSVGAIGFEQAQWKQPDATTWWAIGYNAVMIFGFAHAAWFYLARGLPPVASTLSVMFIPVLGVFSGALWLGEVLHWQDWAAVVLVVVAIASVLWPSRRSAA